MKDLHNLNRSYLIIVRDAVKTDKPSACARFNIDQDFANTLANMSLQEIAQAAQTNDVLFRPTMSGRGLGKLVSLGDQTARTVMAAMASVARGENDKAHA